MTPTVEEVRQVQARAVTYVENCRLRPGEYAFSSYAGGQETLYASALVVMILQTLACLSSVPQEERRGWVDYLNQWQDAKTGLFIGPELALSQLMNPEHGWDMVTWHLTAHVLPALSVLGGTPAHPLRFAHRLVDHKYLMRWLDARNWAEAWKEGNNLVAAGQFLIWLRDREGIPEANEALDLLFASLDNAIDPVTGLWGTDRGCSALHAMYGAYHQLLLYYHEERPIPWAQRLVDTTLSLQHVDGGFHPAGGGGACEDTDGIDILVNLYKLYPYKRPQIRRALRRAVPALLSKQLPDGGFAYRLNEPFIHLGVRRTQTPANVSNMFPTWFRLHALALAGEILTDHPVGHVEWGFNMSCSMGWHHLWDKRDYTLRTADRLAERFCDPAGDVRFLTVEALRAGRRVAGRMKRRLRFGLEPRRV